MNQQHTSRFSEQERADLLALLEKEWAGIEILHRESQLKPYECDAMASYTQLPLAVVLPETEAQVQVIMRTCYRLGLPVVARGAGTGLTGSATPIADGILLVMTRFNRILALNPDARTAKVQPSVRNLAVSEAAAAHGLFYAPDPSSQLACTIGGNIAQNSGGLHCVKYGLTTHNVLKIRMVLADGNIAELGSDTPDVAGLDLLPLFIGSEGMFGVITEATLKLLPQPETARVMQISFDDMGKAGDAVANVIAAGIIPAGLEMMDGAATRAVENYLNAGLDEQAEAILLCESDGMAAEVDEEIQKMEAVFWQSGAKDIKISRNEIERVALWAARKAVFPATANLAPDSYCMDGTVPRRKIGEMLAFSRKMSRYYELPCINVFHAGDGNMHPLILFDNQKGEWEKAEAFGMAILEECVRLGGTITGEHGVGVEKLNAMCSQFADAEREMLWGVKAAFDTAGILNPDKALPTRKRCTEYGLAREQQVLQQFADLERF
ncbi:MAG: FAD-linked oxidase C-terminal domain-containing protein [Neisseria sp.]|nr:FAD-linked oxidase C-terminal domain-containing protein [Neisseria sp.]